MKKQWLRVVKSLFCHRIIEASLRNVVVLKQHNFSPLHPIASYFASQGWMIQTQWKGNSAKPSSIVLHWEVDMGLIGIHSGLLLVIYDLDWFTSLLCALYF